MSLFRFCFASGVFLHAQVHPPTTPTEKDSCSLGINKFHGKFSTQQLPTWISTFTVNNVSIILSFSSVHKRLQIYQDII